MNTFPKGLVAMVLWVLGYLVMGLAIGLGIKIAFDAYDWLKPRVAREVEKRRNPDAQ